MLNMQIALKCSLVMLVNKVNFGEWVKRQMKLPKQTNKKKNKQKISPKQNKHKTKEPKPQAINTPNILVFHL